MGNNREFSAGNQADWSRDACRTPLLQPVNLINWGVFFTRRDAAKANDFIRHMQTETRYETNISYPLFFLSIVPFFLIEETIIVL